MTNSKKILIGGQALVELGSSRSTNDRDYLVYDKEDSRLFIHDSEDDLVNAANHGFYKEIWEMEKENEIASAKALLNMKAFSFVQHVLNMNFRKENDAIFDMNFLCNEYDLSKEDLDIVKKHVTPGEFSEIVKEIRK